MFRYHGQTGAFQSGRVVKGDSGTDGTEVFRGAGASGDGGFRNDRCLGQEKPLYAVVGNTQVYTQEHTHVYKRENQI